MVKEQQESFAAFTTEVETIDTETTPDSPEQQTVDNEDIVQKKFKEVEERLRAEELKERERIKVEEAKAQEKLQQQMRERGACFCAPM